MSYTNTTNHYNLPQYVADDVPSILTDLNNTYANLDTHLYNIAETSNQAKTKANELDTTVAGLKDGVAEAKVDANLAKTTADGVATKQGNLEDLSTTNKDTIVGAINEINAKPSGGEDSRIGDLANLNTNAKDSIVNAINEVNNKEAQEDSRIGDLSTLTTNEKSNIVGAINEENANIGNLTTLTTSAKDSLVSALNEVNGKTGGVTSSGVKYLFSINLKDILENMVVRNPSNYYPNAPKIQFKFLDGSFNSETKISYKTTSIPSTAQSKEYLIEYNGNVLGALLNSEQQQQIKDIFNNNKKIIISPTNIYYPYTSDVGNLWEYTMSEVVLNTSRSCALKAIGAWSSGGSTTFIETYININKITAYSLEGLNFEFNKPFNPKGGSLFGLSISFPDTQRITIDVDNKTINWTSSDTAKHLFIGSLDFYEV